MLSTPRLAGVTSAALLCTLRLSRAAPRARGTAGVETQALSAVAGGQRHCGTHARPTRSRASSRSSSGLRWAVARGPGCALRPQRRHAPHANSSSSSRTGSQEWREQWMDWWWSATNAEATEVLAAMPEADVNARDARGQTKLMWAVDMKDVKMMQSLIESGANVNSSSRKGTTAAIFALWNEDALALQLLVDSGADLTVRDTQFGFTLLMWAVQNGDLLSLKVLLAAGVDVHARDLLGLSAVDLAKQQNQHEALEILQAHIAKLD